MREGVVEARIASGRCPRGALASNAQLALKHGIGPLPPGFRDCTEFREPGGGARRNRTADLLNAIQALYQLSYGPPGIPSGVRPYSQPLRGPQPHPPEIMQWLGKG